MDRLSLFCKKEMLTGFLIWSTMNNRPITMQAFSAQGFSLGQITQQRLTGCETGQLATTTRRTSV